MMSRLRNIRFYLFAVPSIVSLFFCSCGREHLIRDAAYRHETEREFREVRQLARQRKEALFGVLERHLTTAQKEGLMFLYAYMPLSDLADYDGEYFLRQVQAALRARGEMPWGNSIPEEIFLHYVLPPRVNNENLDTFRQVFYDELKARVAGLDLEEAVLEINHWCHEKVSYQPADIRTSSPLNTVKNARGRCGEESTFTVAALRTLAIPARQVYVPRWAHTDDNHAWVEVWVNGQWRFLGACEPDPALDMGWFAGPASRAMLIHTKAFGAYHGNEPLVRREKKYAEINCLHRYADTRKIMVKVVDDQQNPLPGAVVSFRLYNYAEFYPLASLTAGDEGTVSFETGYGDLLVWVSHNDHYAFDRMEATQDTLLLIPSRSGNDTFTIDFDMIPPPEKKRTVQVDEEASRRNALRLRQEDSIRMAYIETFFDTTEAISWAVDHGYPPSPTASFLVKSMGNHPVITAFLEKVPDTLRWQALLLLANVSDKDLRDITPEVLEDHLLHAPPRNGDSAFYGKYLLSPRVDNELLVPYRAFFLNNIPREQQKAWKNDPEKLAAHLVTRIHLVEEANYYHVPLTPRGSWELGMSDLHSLQILLVAVCRTLGVPAYLDKTREVVRYHDRSGWHDLFFPGEDKLPGLTAFLTLSGETDAEYAVHFTLARYHQGNFRTMDFPFMMKASRFHDHPMDPGHYLLVTGKRLKNGCVMSRMKVFSLEEGERATVPLLFREDLPPIRPLGRLPQGLLQTCEGEQVPLASLFRPEGALLCWVDLRHEPSRHVLNELPGILSSLDGWKGDVCLILNGREGEEGDLPASIPPEVRILTDPSAALLGKLLKDLGKEAPPDYPVVIVTDGEGIVYDLMTGYRISLAERIVRTTETILNQHRS